MTESHGPQNAFDLLFQNQKPSNFGLIHGRFLTEAIPFLDKTQFVKPVFCNLIGGRVCNPNYVPKEKPITTQSIVSSENQKPSVKVIRNGNKITDEIPILCADCPIARKNIK